MKLNTLFLIIALVGVTVFAAACATPPNQGTTGVPPITQAPPPVITPPSTPETNITENITINETNENVTNETSNTTVTSNPTAYVQSIFAQTSPSGTILTDSNGMTLYTFSPDSVNDSTCYGQCATAWPPAYLPDDNAPAVSGLPTDSIGVMERSDGTFQATYNGMPLYYFIHDTQPGDMKGDGIYGFGGTWYVARDSSSDNTSNMNSGSSGGSGGYSGGY